jgi:hypothetical protein
LSKAKDRLIGKILKRLQDECIFPVNAYAIEKLKVILREEL